jgi:hypothetical protein
LLLCVGVIVMRKPILMQKGFRVPFVPVFPIVGVIICNFDGWFTYCKLGKTGNLDGYWVVSISYTVKEIVF